MKSVLIATLGTEAQIVTLTLLALRQQGVTITDVVVIHSASQNVQIVAAITQLKQAFATDARLQPYGFRLDLLHGKRAPVQDMLTDEDAEAAFNEIFRIVRRYKLNGYQIHLNIAGGRKPMAIYGMVTAQLLFDEHDRLWYLFSDDALVQSRRLFPEPGDTYRLVAVPVIRASDRPDLVVKVQTAQEALQEQERQRLDKQYDSVLTKLTPTQYAVIQLMARGYSNKQIARERNNEENTIHKHISEIYGKWRDQFGPLNRAEIRHRIVSELQGYFIRQGEK